MRKTQATMFDTEDLPLFSQTAQRAKEQPFQPQAVQIARLPGMDEPPDWTEMAENRNRIIRPKRKRGR